MTFRSLRLGLGAAPLLTLPWLVPPQQAPSPSVLPWLVTLVCAALLILLYSRATGTAEQDRLGAGASLATALLAAAAINTAIALAHHVGVASHLPLLTPAEAGQVYGNLRQRNHYASLTLLGLLAALWWAGRARPGAGAAARWTLPLLAAALAAGTAASGSRTGLLAMVVVSLLEIVWGAGRSGPRLAVLSTAWLGYGLMALAQAIGLTGQESGGILGRLGAAPAPCATRSVMWMNTLELIAARPWTGWGWGELDYAHFMTDYQGMRQCEHFDNAHNLWLHLAVELGLPLAALAFAAALYAVWRGRPWAEEDPTRRLAWAVLVVILLHSQLEYPLWYGPFFGTAAFCALYLLWRGWPRSRSWRVLALAGARLLALLMLLATAYAAWDYRRVSQIYRVPEQRLPAYRTGTLEKIRGSWLFRDQVQFAEFTLTALTRENAPYLHALGLQLLHYSPEPRVIEKLIDAATMLELGEHSRLLVARYRQAYPREYTNWQSAGGRMGGGE
jgi:O-antigen ligase